VRDRDRIDEHLDQHPEDGASRLILADLLEESGQEEEAQVQRWLEQNHCWPDNDLALFRETGWHWWSCPDQQGRRVYAVVPTPVQAFMPHGEWLYATRGEAEAVLGEALRQAGQV
jgi:uncharacterized protein (TIGR02996 family)